MSRHIWTEHKFKKNKRRGQSKRIDFHLPAEQTSINTFYPFNSEIICTSPVSSLVFLHQRDTQVGHRIDRDILMHTCEGVGGW